MEMILKATGLKKYYGRGDTMVKALDGVDLEIERGKFTAIIGTSGSGKSTLLNLLGGLDVPTEGSVKVGDTELAGLDGEHLTLFRRRQIGFIFQNYNLIPVLTVWENIVFPVSLDGSQTGSLSWRRSGFWGWKRSWTLCRVSSPEDSSSGQRSPGRWPQGPR